MGVRASITIVHIRKFLKMHHNIVRFTFFLRIAKRSIPRYILFILECPLGLFGPDCKQSCKCINNATCGHFDGFCTCKPGFIGPRCELSMHEVI